MEAIAEIALMTPILEVGFLGAVQLIVIAAALIFKFSMTRPGKQIAPYISKAVRCEKRGI
jgi:hypothetical protein